MNPDQCNVRQSMQKFLFESHLIIQHDISYLNMMAAMNAINGFSIGKPSQCSKFGSL